MKRILAILAFGMLASLAVLAADPIAQMTFRVTDDFGSAVTGAPVVVSTFLHANWTPGGGAGHDVYDKIQGITDTNGIVTLELPSKTGNVRYSVFAEGTYFDNMYKMRIGNTAYYRDMGGTLRFDKHQAGNWQPRNPVTEIQVKAVLNPIPMYARYLESWSFKFPIYNTSLGYDLVQSDWLPPYGNGTIADCIFKLDCQLGATRSDGIQLFDATLTLSFSNDGDGIQELKSPIREGSVFRLPRFAPEDGYSSNWISKTFAHTDGDYCKYDEEQSFFFRIRSEKDEKGKIVSALYGKIQGPLFYEVRANGARMKWRYYLNPTPNDRNMEFDPPRNLLSGLPTAEQVKDP